MPVPKNFWKGITGKKAQQNGTPSSNPSVQNVVFIGDLVESEAVFVNGYHLSPMWHNFETLYGFKGDAQLGDLMAGRRRGLGLWHVHVDKDGRMKIRPVTCTDVPEVDEEAIDATRRAFLKRN